MRLPNGTVIDDQIGEFFVREHEHPGGYDLHPELRPWASRRYYNITAVAPVDNSPQAASPGDLAIRRRRAVHPIDLGPQTPEEGGM